MINVCFPEAKIIVMTRDRRAVAWSNYKTLFEDNGLNFSNSHEGIDQQSKLYLKYLAFSESLGIETLRVNYSELVCNPAKVISSLFKELDLEYSEVFLSERCRRNINIGTASTLQVRKKIYNDSDYEWKKYRKYLPMQYFE